MTSELKRKELADAFKQAVSGEVRFGNRVDADVVAELGKRWNRVIDLIEDLCRPTRKK